MIFHPFLMKHVGQRFIFSSRLDFSVGGMAATFSSSPLILTIIFAEGTSCQFLSLCFFIGNRVSLLGVVVRPGVWQSENHISNPSRDKEIHLFFKPSKTALDPAKPLFSGQTVPFPRGKAGHSPLSSAKIKNNRNHISTSPLGFVAVTRTILPAPSSLPNLLRQCLHQAGPSGRAV